MIAREELSRIADAHGLAPRSLVVRRLDDVAETSVDAQCNLYPASMIKTPLVAAALVEISDGTLHLDERIEVTHSNMTHNDAPSPLVPGYRARLDEVCTLAIERSDNVATNTLFDLIGRERATRIVRERFGLEHTAFYRKLSGSEPLIEDAQWDGVHRNTHPASDAAALFTQIALDRVPQSEFLRRALTAQHWNDKLSHGLRATDRFAHKTGDTSDVSHDGGILITTEGRRYVIVVYTGLESSDANNARFGAFMHALRALL